MVKSYVQMELPQSLIHIVLTASIQSQLHSDFKKKHQTLVINLKIFHFMRGNQAHYFRIIPPNCQIILSLSGFDGNCHAFQVSSKQLVGTH